MLRRVPLQPALPASLFLPAWTSVSSTTSCKVSGFLLVIRAFEKSVKDSLLVLPGQSHEKQTAIILVVKIRKVTCGKFIYLSSFVYL